MKQKEQLENPIVMFDGECNLCNGLVKFIIRRDPRGKLRFAALQSEAGQRLLERFQFPRQNWDSFVVVAGERLYTKSTAALFMVRHLKGAWPLLAILLVVPKPLRDAVYSFVAKRRYKWFGRRESCMLPTPDIQSRFLR